MRPGVDEMDQAIQAVYSAALEPARWPQTLEVLATLAQAPHASLYDTDFASGVVHRECRINIDDDDRRLYLERRGAIDPRLQCLKPAAPRWFSDYDPFDRAFCDSHPFYGEYFRPRGAGETLLSMFGIEGQRIAMLGLVRTLGQPKADRQLREMLDRLLAHLDRAIRITRRFASLASEVIASHNVLDTIDEPYCCVDGNARPIRANAAFDALLRDGDFVAEENGRLRFFAPQAHLEILRAVRTCARIARAERCDENDSRPTFAAAKYDGTVAFVTIAPLCAGPLQTWAGGPSALLRVSEFNPCPDPRRIGRALGLTAAEGRLVASLCRGGTLVRVACELGISPNTAKTHLASVFGKTGTRRQSELIALVSALPRSPAQ